MTDAERIEQLEGDLRAAIFGWAVTIAILLREMIPTSAGWLKTTVKLPMGATLDF